MTKSGGKRLAFRACAPPLSSSCAAAKNLHTPDMPGSFWSSQPCLPRSCLPRPRAAPIAPRTPIFLSLLACGRCAAAERHPAARAHPRRYRARPGRRRCVRPGRAHPADLDPVPPRRGQAGAARARNHPRQHVDLRDRAHRPRLQLFLAPRQHRRGPEQHPPDARPLAPMARRGPARWRKPCPMRAQPGSAPPICAASSRALWSARF